MLTNAILQNNATKLVEGTTTHNVAITCMQACNTSNVQSGGAVTVRVNVYAVPVGQFPNNTTLIYSQVSITGGDTFIVDTERLVLGAGDAIWADCTVANAVVFTVSTVGI